MSDFARDQLLKYGWLEGKGLGKHENGIIEPIKPKIKADTGGVGFVESNYKWWEDVYNQATKNININTTSQKVSIDVKKKNDVIIRTTREEMNIARLKKNKTLTYGSFLKTSTIQDGKVLNHPEYNECNIEENVELLPALNDEELFKACGNRTAHKGARHGLSLNGKLSRIEQQDQKLLEKMNEGYRKTWDTCKDDKKSKNRKKRKSLAKGSVNINEPDTRKKSCIPLKIEVEGPIKNTKISKRKSKRKRI